MQTIILDTIAFFLKRLVDSKVFAVLETLVADAANWELSGPEKRERVLVDLRAVGGAIAPVVAATASWLLNLALEVAVARLKAGAQK